jgi:phage terminase small subunit
MEKKRLTKKQKDFADEYLETGNGTQSALKTYNTKKIATAGSVAYENLRKPQIQEYLKSQAESVAHNMVRLALEAEKESDQISAGKDVLDRAGFKPIDKQESTNTVKIIEVSKEGVKKYGINLTTS